MMKKIINKRCFIIAEAGVNHNGSTELAKKLIDVASESGADAVKFQTFKAENLVSKKAQKADYQTQNMGTTESQFEMIKKLEIDDKTHIELMAYAKQKKIMFLSTPFDHDSIDMLDSLGLEIFKIPSGEITNLPYLRHIASKNKKVILSTGMSNLSDIEKALSILLHSKLTREDITILHANTMYPTPIEDVNLNAMLSIKSAFGCEVGYSDHTLGIEVDIAAVAMGATVIEKHFTLDNTMDGPDHKASLEPEELNAMVRCIRSIEKALGSFIKEASPSETPNMNVARKSIMTSKAIKKGEVFSEDNLTIKRPGNGKSPMLWDEVIGTVCARDYEAETLL